MKVKYLINLFLSFLFVLQVMTAYAATETVTYIHTDHLGSPILGRDANGVTVFEYDYSPYGERIVNQGEAGFVGYTGHAQDEALGLTYARARWIDPDAGRFLSPDAVLFSEGGENHFNRYSYAYDNPINNIDPDGNAAAKGPYCVLEGGGCVNTAGGIVNGGGSLGRAPRGYNKPRDFQEISSSKPGTSGGSRAGKPHTRGAVKEAIKRNAEQNAGNVKCTNCNVNTTPTTRRTKGSKVDPRERQGDHITPKSKGGNGATVKDQSNIDIKCAKCNRIKSNNVF